MSSSKTIGPISLVFLALGIVGVFATTIFMPAAELVPAQVNPAPRESGESPVRIPAAMEGFAKLGLQMIELLPKPGVEENTATANKSSEDIVSSWEANIIKENGDAYGKQVIQETEARLGNRENVKKVIELMHADKNYFYTAYSLFLGLAMFAGAVAIQAIGRYGAEEKTIIPAKK